jgi:hypothetical protein
MARRIVITTQLIDCAGIVNGPAIAPTNKRAKQKGAAHSDRPFDASPSGVAPECNSLLQLDGRAGCFQLGLELVGFGLAGAFLDRLRS